MDTQLTAFSLLRNSDARHAEMKWIEKLQNREWADTGREKNLDDGISVIIPAYHAGSTIERLLDSLAVQTLDKDLFEIVLVCNGEDDGTYALAEAYSDILPLRLYSLDIASAAMARNFGISLARRQYLTFVDADDSLEENFLTNVFTHCSPNRVVVSPIVDIQSDGTRDEDSTLNQRIRERQSTTCSPQDITWLFGFNACKTFNTELVNDVSFNEKLKSGEDVVFFANFLTFKSLEVFFPDFLEDSAYIRYMTDNSVSRVSSSFDFDVIQRVECIRALQEIPADAQSAPSIDSLIKSQLIFIDKYTQDSPEVLDELEKYLDDTEFFTFPWNYLNKGKEHSLAISYCFPPFSDTSGVIAAKAIAERRRIVDVIYNDMSAVRSLDESTMLLCSRWLDETIQISGKTAWSDWNHISQFALDALEAAKNRYITKGGYESLYTRALWIGSHAAGFLFKRKFPTIPWTAEFSDPLRYGADGKPRQGKYTDNHLSKLFLQAISSFHVSTDDLETVFDLVELATFLTADEIIFTNENQKNYMLMPYPKKVRDLVSKKAIVRPHPSPRTSLYQVKKANYFLKENRVHIGYFGAFYANRGLGDVFQALDSLDFASQSDILLHIFTNNIDEAEEQVEKLGLSHCVVVNKYLPYLEFLNLSAKFDVLLLNDVDTGSNLPINPFLPSKLSDYKGSGSAIWGIVDSDSPLSREDLNYKDKLNDIPSLVRTLQEIIANHKDS